MKATIQTSEELDLLIDTEVGLAVYYSSISCGVCHILGPKVKAMIEKEYPLIKYVDIRVDLYPEIANEKSVFSGPTLLIFLDGKEFIRICGNMGIPQLREKIRRPYEILNS